MIVILVARRTTPLSDQLTSIEPLTVYDPEREDLMVQVRTTDGEAALNDRQSQDNQRPQA